jgi:hypothetical protein
MVLVYYTKIIQDAWSTKHKLVPSVNNKQYLHLQQIIIIIVMSKDTISFMQGIYTCIPETNHVPKKYMLQLFCRYCLWCPYH